MVKLCATNKPFWGNGSRCNDNIRKDMAKKVFYLHKLRVCLADDKTQWWAVVYYCMASEVTVSFTRHTLWHKLVNSYLEVLKKWIKINFILILNGCYTRLITIKTALKIFDAVRVITHFVGIRFIKIKNIWNLVTGSRKVYPTEEMKFHLANNKN